MPSDPNRKTYAEMKEEAVQSLIENQKDITSIIMNPKQQRHDESNPKCERNWKLHNTATPDCTCTERVDAPTERAEKCKCKEMSCSKECSRKHTHKGFFCDVCSPPQEPLRGWSKERYIQMWDSGQFSWNGDIKNSINPERMWQVFIEPAIASAEERGREQAYATNPSPQIRKLIRDTHDKATLQSRTAVIARVREWKEKQKEHRLLPVLSPDTKYYKAQDMGYDVCLDDMETFLSTLEEEV